MGRSDHPAVKSHAMLLNELQLITLSCTLRVLLNSNVTRHSALSHPRAQKRDFAMVKVTKHVE